MKKSKSVLFYLNTIYARRLVLAINGVLLFFYKREEYYEPTPENKGVATVILAKQRNGPTGDLEIKFFDEYARFSNLDNFHRQNSTSVAQTSGDDFHSDKF